MSDNPAFGIKLADLFAKRIFRIPDYQRGYAWGERQLTELWQDIEDIESIGKVAEGEDVPQNGRAVAPLLGHPLRGQPSAGGCPRPPMEVIFCCFSERDKKIYERMH